MTMTVIEHIELASAQTSIEFTSIASGFTDLRVVLSARLTNDTTTFGVWVRFNGSTTGFSHRRLYGRGSTVASNTVDQPVILNPSTFTASTFGNTSIYIPSYTSSAQKSFSVDSVIENNATLAYQLITAGLWTGTSAITSIELTSANTTFTQYSSATLYGISAGSDGTTTVS